MSGLECGKLRTRSPVLWLYVQRPLLQLEKHNLVPHRFPQAPILAAVHSPGSLSAFAFCETVSQAANDLFPPLATPTIMPLFFLLSCLQVNLMVLVTESVCILCMEHIFCRLIA